MGEQRGLLLEPRFPQIERGELSLRLASSADRAPHYVDPTGLPLLHSKRLTPQATRTRATLAFHNSVFSPEK